MRPAGKPVEDDDLDTPLDEAADEDRSETREIGTYLVRQARIFGALEESVKPPDTGVDGMPHF